MNRIINFLRHKLSSAAQLLASEYASHRARFSLHVNARIGHEAMEYVRFAIFLSGSIFLGILLAAIIV